MAYLLDTNVVIDFLRASLPPTGMKHVSLIIDDVSIISLITKIEILGFRFSSLEEEMVVNFFVSQSSVLAIDEPIVNQTIILRKAHRIKLPDAVIAATAITHNLTLVTRNTSDFKSVKDLSIINPH